MGRLIDKLKGKLIEGIQAEIPDLIRYKRVRNVLEGRNKPFANFRASAEFMNPFRDGLTPARRTVRALVIMNELALTGIVGGGLYYLVKIALADNASEEEKAEAVEEGVQRGEITTDDIQKFNKLIKEVDEKYPIDPNRPEIDGSTLVGSHRQGGKITSLDYYRNKYGTR